MTPPAATDWAAVVTTARADQHVPAQPAPVYRTALTDTAIVRVTGADAGDFLHGQLAADCRKLTAGECIQTAWCSPQGRVLFLLHVISAEDAFYLLCPTDQVAQLCRRLALYVLRAAVVIEDLSASHGVFRIDGSAPALQHQTGPVSCVRASNGERHWLAGPHAALFDLWVQLDLPIAGAMYATLLDIRGTQPTLSTALSDQFLPQELDLDYHAGVSFNKGCYPGQEIIARVKFRGSVKRRLAHLVTPDSTLPAAGERLADSHDKPLGTVLLAAHNNAGETEILAVLAVTAATAGLAGKSCTLTRIAPPAIAVADDD